MALDVNDDDDDDGVHRVYQGESIWSDRR